MNDPTDQPPRRNQQPEDPEAAVAQPSDKSDEHRSKEHGGQAGPDPTRYGDWERGGRCIDF